MKKIILISLLFIGCSTNYLIAQIEEPEEVAEEVPTETVFQVVEEMPLFPGGQTAMVAFLSKNIKYPKEAMDAGIQGVVYVQFVVDAEGNVNDARVVRGIGAGCDREALRVINQMPKWTPGVQRGKAVRVRMTLPIRYAYLEED